jgi:hypothetical protein
MIWMARKRPRTRRGLPTAIGLGLAGGMRTFIPPATIALRDQRPKSRLLRLSILLASAGELAADKSPKIPSRTDPAGLGSRFASSGAVGWTCAGPIGGLFAGSTAIASAYAMHALRGDLGKRSRLPDPVLGAAEDSLAMAIARLATRRPLDTPTPPAKPGSPAPAGSSPPVVSKPPPPASKARPAASKPPLPDPAPSTPKPPTGRKAVKAAKVAAKRATGRKAVKAAKAAAKQAGSRKAVKAAQAAAKQAGSRKAVKAAQAAARSATGRARRPRRRRCRLSRRSP